MFNQKYENMFYKYDEKKMQYIKINVIKNSVLWVIIISTVFFIIGLTAKSSTSIDDFSETEVKLILLKEQKFTEDKLVGKIKALNFKYPHIVYAQAILETGDFRSKMFMENNNLFGMKEARVRINTAKGTQYEHAYYDNWKESLYDYALYSSRYLSSISNENEYFNYLGQFYAEDKEYVSKLKGIIQKENLIELFAVK